VWGAPVVIDGVHILPEVECVVPSWLRQEFLARTSDLGLPAGQHYVYPGVRSPLLLPSDYIRKYFPIYSLLCSFGSVFVLKTVLLTLQLWLQCGLISGCMLCGWVAMF